MSEPSHEILEHVGELELSVRASSQAELFAEAGRALGEILLRGTTGRPEDRDEEIALRGSDRDALLVEWLNELIYHADTHGRVLREYEFARLTETELRCRARGVLAEATVPVKAATFHGLAVADEDGTLTAHIILDI